MCGRTFTQRTLVRRSCFTFDFCLGIRARSRSGTFSGFLLRLGRQNSADSCTRRRRRAHRLDAHHRGRQRRTTVALAAGADQTASTGRRAERCLSFSPGLSLHLSALSRLDHLRSGGKQLCAQPVAYTHPAQASHRRP